MESQDALLMMFANNLRIYDTTALVYTANKIKLELDDRDYTSPIDMKLCNDNDYTRPIDMELCNNNDCDDYDCICDDICDGSCMPKKRSIEESNLLRQQLDAELNDFQYVINYYHH